ncbi:profilin [Paraphysoderma sedebokerense]|nr:profilin [Paraphysoderma sedebokerense]
MSWQAYVDNNLVGTKKIQKGAIYGHDKNLWAASPGFSVQPAELDALIKAFKDPSGIRAGGLRVNNVKYIALKCDDRSVYGKQGSGGVICVKTKQAVLIGTYDESAQPGEATKVVEALADYLISVNY